MIEVSKRFQVALDIKRASANPDITVVEGDNGNLLEITLTDNGAPVDLTDCYVCAIFSKSDGRTAQQDNRENGVTIDLLETNRLTIELYTSSFAPGLVEAEIQVFSGLEQKMLVTSAKFNFMCRRAIANSDTLPATNEWPLLVGLMLEAEQTKEELGRLNEQTLDAAQGAQDAALYANSIGDALNLWEDFDHEKEYIPLNKVAYKGSSYVCIEPCQGVLPTSTECWLLIAKRGASGDGSGDMVREIYDTNDNGIVDDAEHLGGRPPSHYVKLENIDAAWETIITLTAEDWQGFGPFNQTIAVEKIAEDMAPIFDVVQSDDLPTAREELIAFDLIDRVDANNGSITFVCYDLAPAVDITIRAKVTGDNAEPEPGPPGEKGDKGDKGEKGDGPDMSEITATEIDAVLSA